MVKLHLGCGLKRYRGYVNIDNRGIADVYGDITRLPYEPETISEILAVHVFEHFFPWKAEEILKHWYSLLKPGGKLVLEMPDLDKILEHFKNPEASIQLTLLALYGGEKSERIEDLHKWAWNYSTLSQVMEGVGFKCEKKPALFHVPIRDFIIEGVK